MVTALFAAVAFVLGLAVGFWLVSRTGPDDGLPCPNLPCTNRLPRRGMWSFKTTEWALEDCQVCGATVQYRSHHAKSAALHENDCYIRVERPETAPTGGG